MQIDLISIQSNVIHVGIFLLIASLVDHMSKQQMCAAIENKKALTITRVVNRWIYIYGLMDILQNDN